MYTKVWKVYGHTDIFKTHRQRESFHPSHFAKIGENVFMAVINSDITGTNEYTIMSITAENEDECDREFNGQLSDGVFENSNYGYRELFMVIDHDSAPSPVKYCGDRRTPSREEAEREMVHLKGGTAKRRVDFGNILRERKMSKGELEELKNAVRHINGREHCFYISGDDFSCCWNGCIFLWQNARNGSVRRMDAEDVIRAIGNGKHIEMVCYDFNCHEPIKENAQKKPISRQTER